MVLFGFCFGFVLFCFSTGDYNRKNLSTNWSLCKQFYKINYGIRVNEMAPAVS